MTPVTSQTPGVSESAFQRAVIDYAVRSGWLVAHFGDSRREVVNGRTGERKLVGDRQAKGYPDLTLVRDGRMVFAELKAEGGRPSPEQERWLLSLGEVEEACPGVVEVHCWKPSDWPRIERLLTRRWAE